MKKIIIKINGEKEFLYDVSGYIVGLNDFSILFGKTYDVDEIKEIRKKFSNKKIFVSLNKPIFNDDLDNYKKVLIKLDELGLDGIIASDVSILTYNLKTNIILDFMHLNNSYETINHYYNNGAYGVFLTNDITFDEINEIKANSKVELFKQVFGYAHLSTSKRKFISNYFEYYNKKRYNAKYYEISEDKNNYYKIIEDNNLTHILSDKVLNLLEYFNSINADYYVIDSYMIDKDISIVVNSFMEGNTKNNEKINDLYDADNGFINKKTIYKVVKNEE